MSTDHDPAASPPPVTPTVAEIDAARHRLVELARLLTSHIDRNHLHEYLRLRRQHPPTDRPDTE